MKSCLDPIFIVFAQNALKPAIEAVKSDKIIEDWYTENLTLFTKRLEYGEKSLGSKAYSEWVNKSWLRCQNIKYEI